MVKLLSPLHRTTRTDLFGVSRWTRLAKARRCGALAGRMAHVTGDATINWVEMARMLGRVPSPAECRTAEWAFELGLRGLA